MSKLSMENYGIVYEEINQILNEYSEINNEAKTNNHAIDVEYDIFYGDEGRIRVLGLFGTVLFSVIFFGMFFGGIFYFEYLHHYMGYITASLIMWVSASLIIISLSMFSS